MRRLKFFFTTLLLLCFTVTRAQEIELGGVNYNLSSEGDAGVIEKNTGKYSGDVVIPDIVTYNGVDYKVTYIHHKAFYKCSGLKSVVIPNSVQYIGQNAFQACSNLKSVTIGNGLRNSLYGAFQSCNNLSEVHINSIDDWFKINFWHPFSNPLYYATKLYLNGELVTDIVVPDGITEIKPYLFYNCHLTGGLVIPEGVTKIGKKTFAGGGTLASVTISKTVLEIDSSFYSRSAKKFIFLGNTPPRHLNDAIYRPTADIIYVSNSQIYGFGTEYERLSSMFEVNGVRYVPLSVTECDVIDSRYNDSAANVVVDSVVTYSKRTFAVKDIKPFAFYANTHVKRAYVNNDGYVGTSAFHNCDNLAGEVVIENNGEIWSSAFYDCDAIEGVKISNNGNVGTSAFYDCDAIVNADIKNNGNIESSAFYDCDSLDNVNIRNNGYVGVSAFYYCLNMTSANVDCQSVIKKSAFQNCLKLNNLVLGEDVEMLGEAAFKNCRSLPSLAVPNYITSIGKSCFQGCHKLKKVTIGDGIKNLEDNLFDDCISLVDMTIGVNVDSIQRRVFNNCSSLPTIKIPVATGIIKDSVFTGCSSLKNVIFEDSDKEIELNSVKNKFYGYWTNASTDMFPDSPLDSLYIGRPLSFVLYKGDGTIFNDNSTLRTVVFGEPKENCNTGIFIGTYMFENCTNLKNAKLSDRVTSISSCAFRNCISLPKIVIPNSVTSGLGSSCFSGCSSLEEAMVGNGVSGIEASVFRNCTSLVKVKLGEKVSSINRSAFYNCSSLPEITIPAATIELRDSVFYKCKNLTRFFAEDGTGVLKMGVNAKAEGKGKIGDDCPLFIDCQLDSVYLGRNLSYNLSQEYGYSPFYFNKTLRAVVIGDMVDSVFTNEFYQCSELKYVSLGNGVTSVGDWAFSSCVSLDHFSFGVGLETIGKEAFSDCNNITTIITTRTVPPVCGDQALADINMFDCTIYVPSDCVDAYMNADQWREFWIKSLVKTYTLSFVIDGEVYASYQIEEGGEIILPEAPVREGYVFSGWSEIPEVMPAEDVTVTGSFTTKAFTVTYKIGEEVYTTAEVVPGSTIELPTAPAKEGYTFVGWCNALADVIDIASNADAMLYTNAQCTNTQYGDQFVGWQVLFDGRSDTFFHSEYADNESADGLDHYLRVDMGENPVSFFTFTYTNRNSNSLYYSPKRIVVEGSDTADGDYEEIADINKLSSVDSYVYSSPVIGNGKEYRYIRYRVVETQANTKVYNHPYFHIGEFGMASVAVPSVMPEDNLVLVAVYEALPITSGVCGDNATWSIDNGVLTISGSGAMFDYMGDDTPWNDYRMTDIKAVVVEEGITHIGNSAFRGFEVAKSVSLPNTVISIGERAFSGNALTSITLPANLETIGNNAFYICRNLSGELVIPGSVTSIGESAFNKCSALTSLTFSYGVESIGNMAFNECAGLSGELVIPNSVAYIGEQAFLRCANITGVTLSENMKTISYGSFSRTGLTSLVVPEGVTRIEDWAFDNIPALASLSLPSTIDYVGNYAFTDCAALESITVANPVPTVTGSEVFANIHVNATLYVPKGAKAAYEAAYGWSTIPNIVELVNTRLITYMVDGAVYATEEVEVGDEIVPIAAPEKDGYEFIEWRGLPAIMPAEDIVVEAVYERVAGLSGDINKDGEVNVGDFAALVNIILNSESIDDTIKSVSDINADGEVNVGDFAALVNLIFNSGSQASPQRAATRAAADETTFYIEPFSIAAGETKVIPVLMENPDEVFSQLQFDITLPEGLEIPESYDEDMSDYIKEIKHGSRTSQKLYSIQTQPVGEALRVLCITQNSK
ncbi:MAG: leucine-rich repeat protein, partial [Bacteroidaceae bacterium]|nr:leucine-rich repeat protein [Bacteroidaceae bacterium]